MQLHNLCDDETNKQAARVNITEAHIQHKKNWSEAIEAIKAQCGKSLNNPSIN